MRLAKPISKLLSLLPADRQSKGVGVILEAAGDARRALPGPPMMSAEPLGSSDLHGQNHVRQAATDPAMNRGLSLYLDLVRFVAALNVFFYHLGWARSGHEAVIVFFVLSGYVISIAARNRDKTVARFVISRLTRIYSVTVPALLATVLLDIIGCRIDPAIYHGSAPLHSPILRFAISLLLLNETWISVQAFSNGPFWSVCYELSYYALFACFFFLTGRIRIVALMACVLVVGVRALLLFPVWLMGSWAYFETRSHLWPRWLHCSMFLSPIAVLWVYKAHDITFAVFDLGNSRQFLTDLILGGLLTLHFLGAKNPGPALYRVLRALSTPIRTLADYTFTLYLIHLPIILFVAAVVGGNHWRRSAAIVMAVGTATALIGYFTENQRHKLRSHAERLVEVLRGRVLTLPISLINLALAVVSLGGPTKILFPVLATQAA
jgi:peptidoglycan/LPS O-acetylase OafA/YrhL